MELTKKQNLNEQILDTFMSGLDYSFFENLAAFMRRYPCSIPYTAPCAEPDRYPSEDEFPLWANQVGYLNQADGPDNYLMHYVSSVDATNSLSNAVNDIPDTNAISQLSFLSKITEDIDELVWRVFRKYIHAAGELFSNPSHWVASADKVTFYGKDGCRGCYDDKSLVIPIVYFENTDIELAKLKQDRKQKESEMLDIKKIKAINSIKNKSITGRVFFKIK